MSKGAKIFIGILITLVIVLGALLYRAETKMHTHADDVHWRSASFLFTSFEMQMQIEYLDSVKLDTGERKQRRYEFVKEDFERQNAYRLFVMSSSVSDIGSNQDSLNSLVDQYSFAIDPIGTFYIMHDSVQDIKPGELEQLQNDYRKLKAISERFENMRVDLW